MLALIGLLTEGICNGILAWSAQWLSSGLLAILIATTPFWIVGLDALLPGGERLTRRFALGPLLGFGGLVWLLAPQVRAPHPERTRSSPICRCSGSAPVMPPVRSWRSGGEIYR